MRYLAIHHVYRESKPYVFTNNRVSGTLDTGKPSKDIFNECVFVFSNSITYFSDEKFLAVLKVNMIILGFLHLLVTSK